MKTLLTLIAATCFTGAALGQLPGQPPKPDPAYKAYEVWMGNWQYEGQAQDSPLGPGGKFSGKMTVRPILDGFFVEFRAQEKTPLGDLETIEFDWYDVAAKNYPFQAYINIGAVSSGSATVSGNVWKGSGTFTYKGVQYQTRGETTFTADGVVNTWRSEISTDGKTWALFSEGKGTKVASAQGEQELIDLEKAWTEAVVKRDLAFFDRITADEHTLTAPDGTVMTKAQQVALVKSGEYTVTSAVQDAIKVWIYGDVAVVTGLCTEKSQFKGKDSSGQYRWTDTFIKRDGRWQCVATHASKVAQE
jgi:hypothetical protein